MVNTILPIIIFVVLGLFLFFLFSGGWLLGEKIALFFNKKHKKNKKLFLIVSVSIVIFFGYCIFTYNQKASLDTVFESAENYAFVKNKMQECPRESYEEYALISASNLKHAAGAIVTFSPKDSKKCPKIEVYVDRVSFDMDIKK